MPRHVWVAALLLVGCASQQEEAAFTDWEALRATFRPSHDDGADLAPITSESTLADYVQLALRGNQGLQAQAHRWRARLERIAQARALPNPQLTYGGYVEKIETRSGPMRHRFGVMQGIPWPGKLLGRAGVALEEAEAARARTDDVRQALIARVARAYADYYVLARDREITGETLALVRRWEAVARSRLRAGVAAAHRDAIKAQVEMGRLEDRLASLKDLGGPHADMLRALCDLPRHVELPWPGRLPDPALSRGEDELRTLAREKSPLLAQRRRQVGARRQGVDLAWLSYVPDLMVGAEYIEVGPARGLGRARGGGDDGLVGKVGLSLPIWFGRNRAAVQEARAQLRAAEAELREAENALSAGLGRALFEFRDADRKARLYKGSLIPKGEQSLRATATAYEAGQGSFLDLLDAERLLLDFHLASERARADRVASFAIIERLVGLELGGETK